MSAAEDRTAMDLIARMDGGEPPADVVLSLSTASDVDDDDPPSAHVGVAVTVTAIAIGVRAGSERFVALGALVWLAFNEGRRHEQRKPARARP